MAASPSFAGAPTSGWAALTAANTAMDGTGTTSLILTAGASGAFLRRIIARALGTNVKSVARVFLNNGLTPATAVNNTLIGEIDLPATTASNTTAQVAVPELAVNEAIPAGYRVYVCLGTAVAAGWELTALGGGDF